MDQMNPLRRRMIEDMTVRNLAPATQQSYLYAVAKFSRHFARSPARLGLEHVRAYQVHLAAQKRSWVPSASSPMATARPSWPACAPSWRCRRHNSPAACRLP
jgi:hypothetical protein